MKKIFFLFFFFSHPLFSEDYYHCKTTAHNGLEFLGKDYGEIINYLGLGDFKIKLSRSREDIIREQNEERKNKKKQFFPKYSHFFELIIIKASGYPDVMHCSWMYDVRFDKKENRNTPICFPKNSTNKIPNGTVESKEVSFNPSKETPALAKANRGIIK